MNIGVPVCWIFDPLARRGWTVTSAGLDEAKYEVLRTAETAMPLVDILEQI